MRGPKHGSHGTINAKILRKNRFSPSDGGPACSDRVYRRAINENAKQPTLYLAPPSQSEEIGTLSIHILNGKSDVSSAEFITAHAYKKIPLTFRFSTKDLGG